MARASREHNLIALNLAVSLETQIRDRPYEVYGSDMRVKIDATGLYTCPDMVVTCEKPQFEDGHFDTLLNPQVLIEVLSDSTESYDRGKKSEHYRQIASLREYLLVAQDEPHVEVYSRLPDGRWLLTEARGLESAIELFAIDCHLKLADVYTKVNLAQE